MTKEEAILKTFKDIVCDLVLTDEDILAIKQKSLLRVNLAILYNEAFLNGMQEAEKIWLKKGEK